MSQKSTAPTTVKDLTMKKIAQDGTRAIMNCTGKAFFGYFFGFIGLIFLVHFCSEPDDMELLIATIFTLAVSAAIFLWAWNSARQQRKRIFSGEIGFILSQVDHLKMDHVDDEYGKVYLHFSLGPEGRYVSRNSVRGDTVQIGDPYYLVLDRNRKGKLYVLSYYAAQQFRLDAQLRELLARDVQLTGEQISLQEVQERENRAGFEKMRAAAKERMATAKAALPELTGEQMDALPGKYIRLKKWERFLRNLSFYAPIVFLVLGFLLGYLKFGDAAWYYRLAYTLVLLLCCYGSIFVRLRLEKRSDHIWWLLRASGIDVPELPEKAVTSRLGGVGCLLHAAGYFFSFIGHIINALVLYLIWFGGA